MTVRTAASTSAQALGVPRILAKSAIPFINLSSGTVSAAGAISAITALPIAYASAYCYLPANAAATVSAAGWYYCTFSTTQAGTLYLNTYTSGIPAIPASPTPCTTASSFTGDSSGDVNGPTITVPANAMGANGALRILSAYQVNNTANNKIYRVRFSGGAGTVFAAQNLISTLAGRDLVWIANRGVTNVQIGTDGSGGAGIGGLGTIAQALTAAAVDTTAATSVVISVGKAAATDNHVLESFIIELLSDGT